MRFLPVTFKRWSSITLRSYQQECIDKCLGSLKEGKRRIAVSLATGGGKTIIFASLIKQIKSVGTQGGKALILVHRRELAKQASLACKAVMENKLVGVDVGTEHSDVDADVTVASVQTLLSDERLAKYDPRQYKVIIIDEAHHAAAKSYLRVLKYFGADHLASDIVVVGFSATLTRHDGQGLNSSMDHIVYHKGLDDMIDEGWLCDASFTTVNTNVDLSEVGSRLGDFAVKQLSLAVNVELSNHLILRTYLKFRQEHAVRSTLLFGVDIAHIKTLNQLFTCNGVVSEYITGTTKKEVRDDLVTRFKNGEIEVLMNCGIFTEGTDIPNVDCVFLARPTKSTSLLLQMMGRGLRLKEGKAKCHVVDFVSSCSQGISTIPTLVGLEATEMLESQSLSDMKNILEQNLRKKLHDFQIDTVDFSTFQSLQDYMFSKHQQNSDYLIFKKDDLNWIYKKDTWALSIMGDMYLRIIKSDDGYTLKKYVKNKSSQGHTAINLIKLSPNVLQIINAVRSGKLVPRALLAANRKDASWRALLASEKQRDFIRSRLVFLNDKKTTTYFESNLEKFIANLNKGLASDLIFAKAVFGNGYFKSLVDYFNREDNEIIDQLEKVAKQRIRLRGLREERFMAKTQEPTISPI